MDGFEKWMAAVDKHIDSMLGLSSRDIADFPYRDAFEAGTTPQEAAKSALEAERFEEQAQARGGGVMERAQLDKILADHKAWVERGRTGDGKADLRCANLCGADLRWADLRWANLRWADLCGADLRCANLRWANLGGADLRWANLYEADLRWANLYGANLGGANLCGANLIGAQGLGTPEELLARPGIAHPARRPIS